MAAPIIISRRNQGGPQALPSLAQGERLLQAQTGAATSVAQAEIGAAQRETAAEIGVSRAVTGEAMRGGEALVKFAANLDRNVTGLGNAVLEAVQQTDLNETQVKRQRARSEAFTAFEQDPDWKTAPDRLTAKFAEIDNEAFKGFGDQQIAAMRAATSRTDLSMERQLQHRAFGKVTNAAQATDQEAQLQTLQQAARATSSAERLGIISERDKQVDDLVKRGIYEATQGSQLKLGFRQQLDQADLYKGIKENPAGTMAALDDPQMFQTLLPQQRETAKAQAQAALDETRGLEAKKLAERDRVAATATYGMNINGEQAAAIFDKIVAQESGGRTNAKSVDGALGVGQLMPGTARDMANQLGLAEAKLPESEFRERLLTDPALNRRLGLAYFQMGLKLSEGSLPAAIAGYHMGQERAAEFHKKAVAQFGQGYSAAQYMSLLPDTIKDGNGKTTSSYVGDLFKRIGADPGRGGVSRNAAFRISDIVEASIKQEDQQQLVQLNKLVAVTQDSRDAVIEAFKSGYVTDPGAVSAAKLPLLAAAGAGDTAAAQKLRQFAELEQVAPLVRQAFQMAPAELEAGISQLRASVAGGASDAASQRRLKVFEAVSSEVAKQSVENPIGLIERSGRRPVTTVPVEGSAPAIAEALQLRAPIAADAMKIYGGDTKVLKPEEAKALKQRWDDAGSNDRFELARALAGALPRSAYEATMKQVAGDDAVATIAGVISRRDPETARLVMKGVELMGQSGVDAKASELRPALQNVLGSDIYPAAVQKQLIDAAQAHYVASRAGKGALFDAGDSKAMEASIEAVAGRMARRAGVKVPLPAGMRPAQLDSIMDGLSEAELGGQPLGLSGKPLDIGFLRRNARLRPQGVGDGLYLVTLPGPGGKEAPVFTAAGGPLVLDVATIGKTRAPNYRGETANDVRRETIYSGAGIEGENWQGPTLKGPLAMPNKPDGRDPIAGMARLRLNLQNLRWQRGEEGP